MCQPQDKSIRCCLVAPLEPQAKCLKRPRRSVVYEVDDSDDHSHLEAELPALEDDQDCLNTSKRICCTSRRSQSVRADVTALKATVSQLEEQVNTAATQMDELRSLVALLAAQRRRSQE